MITSKTNTHTVVCRHQRKSMRRSVKTKESNLYKRDRCKHKVSTRIHKMSMRKKSRIPKRTYRRKHTHYFTRRKKFTKAFGRKFASGGMRLERLKERLKKRFKELYKRCVGNSNATAIQDNAEEELIESFQISKHSSSIDINTWVEKSVDKSAYKIDLNEHSGVTDDCLQSLADKCKMLKIIYLNGCNQVTNNGVIALANGCRLLEIIYLNDTKVKNDGLMELAKCCKLLQIVGLKNCKVTQKGVNYLVNNCNDLFAVDLYRCSEIAAGGAEAAGEAQGAGETEPPANAEAGADVEHKYRKWLGSKELDEILLRTLLTIECKSRQNLPPRPIVISGPTGFDKATLINKLVNDYPDYLRRGTYKRPARSHRGQHLAGRQQLAQERQSALRRDSFESMEDVETSIIFKTFVKGCEVCILDTDIQGTQSIKESVEESALNPLYIFIEPPSIDELEARLRASGTESEALVDMRLKKAWEEMNRGQMSESLFDINIVNNDSDQAYAQLVKKLNKWYRYNPPVSSAIKKVVDELKAWMKEGGWTPLEDTMLNKAVKKERATLAATNAAAATTDRDYSLNWETIAKSVNQKGKKSGLPERNRVQCLRHWMNPAYRNNTNPAYGNNGDLFHKFKQYTSIDGEKSVDANLVFTSVNRINENNGISYELDTLPSKICLSTGESHLNSKRFRTDILPSVSTKYLDAVATSAKQEEMLQPEDFMQFVSEIEHAWFYVYRDEQGSIKTWIVNRSKVHDIEVKKREYRDIFGLDTTSLKLNIPYELSHGDLVILSKKTPVEITPAVRPPLRVKVGLAEHSDPVYKPKSNLASRRYVYVSLTLRYEYPPPDVDDAGRMKSITAIEKNDKKSLGEWINTLNVSNDHTINLSVYPIVRDHHLLHIVNKLKTDTVEVGLESISLEGCMYVTDDGLSYLANNCDSLRMINLQNCTQVTDTGVMQLAYRCQKLEDILLDTKCIAVSTSYQRHLRSKDIVALRRLPLLMADWRTETIEFIKPRVNLGQLIRFTVEHEVSYQTNLFEIPFSEDLLVPGDEKIQKIQVYIPTVIFYVELPRDIASRHGVGQQVVKEGSLKIYSSLIEEEGWQLKYFVLSGHYLKYYENKESWDTHQSLYQPPLHPEGKIGDKDEEEHRYSTIDMREIENVRMDHINPEEIMIVMKNGNYYKLKEEKVEEEKVEEENEEEENEEKKKEEKKKEVEDWLTALNRPTCETYHAKIPSRAVGAGRMVSFTFHNTRGPNMFEVPYTIQSNYFTPRRGTGNVIGDDSVPEAVLYV